MSSIAGMDEATWSSLKEGYKRRISTILIPLDITPGVAKGLLSRIDSFASEVILELGELEGRKEVIESIITEWERTKIAGSNDLERKRRASEALQQYPTGPDSSINMYEVSRTIIERVAFMKSIVKSLEGKQSRLITILGLLKLESNLSPFSTNE